LLVGGFEKHNDKKIGLILHETDPGAVLSLSPASRSRLRNSRFGLDFLSGHANLLTLLLPTTDEQRRNQTLRSDSPIGSRANAGSGAAEEGARGSGQDRPQGLSDAINRFPAKGILGRLTYDIMAEDNAAFLRALDLAPAHLVGSSDGAAVGLLTV
jgi:hypothetical protein